MVCRTSVDGILFLESSANYYCIDVKIYFSYEVAKLSTIKYNYKTISLARLCNRLAHKPTCFCSISQNAPFRTEMCTFLFWMVHCGIWNRCNVGFMNSIHWIGRFDANRLNERFQVQGCFRPLANWNRLPGSLHYNEGGLGPENYKDGYPSGLFYKGS